MIKKEDLSEFLLNSYNYNLSAIGKDEEWGEVALNRKPLETWEKFNGFNLFRNPGFIAEVNALVSKQSANSTGSNSTKVLEQNIKNIIQFCNELEGRIDYLEGKIKQFDSDASSSFMELEYRIRMLEEKE